MVTKVVNEVNLQQRKVWNLKSKVKNWKASRWVAKKYSDAKETVKTATVITKLGLKKPKALIQNPEKEIIGYLNDVLVLYLIRLHWIWGTQEWIPKHGLFGINGQPFSIY